MSFTLLTFIFLQHTSSVIFFYSEHTQLTNKKRVIFKSGLTSLPARSQDGVAGTSFTALLRQMKTGTINGTKVLETLDIRPPR